MFFTGLASLCRKGISRISGTALVGQGWAATRILDRRFSSQSGKGVALVTGYDSSSVFFGVLLSHLKSRLPETGAQAELDMALRLHSLSGAVRAL